MAQSVVEKTREIVAPLETDQIFHFMKNLTFKSAMENPLFIGIFAVIFFYAVVKRSKPVLIILFGAIALMFLVRYTLPADSSNELTVSSTLPFAFGALAIGAALIYFIFIKTD